MDNWGGEGRSVHPSRLASRRERLARVLSVERRRGLAAVPLVVVLAAVALGAVVLRLAGLLVVLLLLDLHLRLEEELLLPTLLVDDDEDVDVPVRAVVHRVHWPPLLEGAVVQRPADVRFGRVVGGGRGRCRRGLGRLGRGLGLDLVRRLLLPDHRDLRQGARPLECGDVAVARPLPARGAVSRAAGVEPAELVQPRLEDAIRPAVVGVLADHEVALSLVDEQEGGLATLHPPRVVAVHAVHRVLRQRKLHGERLSAVFVLAGPLERRPRDDELLALADGHHLGQFPLHAEREHVGAHGLIPRPPAAGLAAGPRFVGPGLLRSEREPVGALRVLAHHLHAVRRPAPIAGQSLPQELLVGALQAVHRPGEKGRQARAEVPLATERRALDLGRLRRLDQGLRYLRVLLGLLQHLGDGRAVLDRGRLDGGRGRRCLGGGDGRRGHDRRFGGRGGGDRLDVGRAIGSRRGRDADADVVLLPEGGLDGRLHHEVEAGGDERTKGVEHDEPPQVLTEQFRYAPTK